MPNQSTTEQEETIQFRREFRRSNPLSAPVRIFHLVSIALLVGGSIAFCSLKITRPSVAEWITIPLMLIFGNLVIYLLHRNVLHRRLPVFNYGYEKHTLMHHRYFSFEAFGFSSLLDLDVILFPIWFVFFLSLILAPTLGYLASRFASANTAYFVVVMVNLNYLLYEVVHYSSHLEADSWVHRIPLFRFMRQHHRIHHKKSLEGKYNFDIILPLFDPLFRTLRMKEEEK